MNSYALDLFGIPEIFRSLLTLRFFTTIFKALLVTGPCPEPHESSSHLPIQSYLFEIHFNILPSVT